jgi:hypothetical protein
MATTLWDSSFNGLAQREVAVNDEGMGATPSMAIRVMASVVTYSRRLPITSCATKAPYVFPVLRGASPVLESELPEPPV